MIEGFKLDINLCILFPSGSNLYFFYAFHPNNFKFITVGRKTKSIHSIYRKTMLTYVNIGFSKKSMLTVNMHTLVNIDFFAENRC